MGIEIDLTEEWYYERTWNGRQNFRPGHVSAREEAFDGSGAGDSARREDRFASGP